MQGAIRRQYYSALEYINNSYLNELIIRVDGSSDNRKIENFPFIALEELLANAIVHNNYENDSPDLFYKTFDANDNVTSVVIPVNEEYYELKSGSKPKEKVWIENETKDFKQKILDSGYTKK